MNLLRKLYLKFFVSSGFPYSEYLSKRKALHFQGSNCFISKGAEISDPYLLSIGDNVWVTDGCRLLGHDASVIMINIMQGSQLDQVGPIEIGDNCFLGNNVIVLPNTKIGANTIIGSGAVVTRNLEGNAVYAGNPARLISSMDEYIEKVTSRSKQFPWNRHLNKNAAHIYDANLEETLRKERVEYFFNSQLSY
jgi:acetyltransferase-like isoleucine patch superfamily enzyme